MSLAPGERSKKTYTLHNDSNFDVRISGPDMTTDERFANAFCIVGGLMKYQIPTNTSDFIDMNLDVNALDPDKFEAGSNISAGQLALTFVKFGETYGPDYGKGN